MNQKKNAIIAALLSVAGCIAMIVFPHISLEAAQKALGLWAQTVVPAMLPFFICAGLMLRLGVPHYMAKYFEKPVRRFFRVPGSAAFTFLMSISSGYPMGAKIITDLRERRQITKQEAERMLSFCSTSGPLFMLGAVGVGMLGSMAAGWVIVISHYIAAILNGLIFRHHGREQGYSVERQLSVKTEPANALLKPYEKESVVSMLTESIFSAVRTLLLIGGYIVIFMMIVSFLEEFLFFEIFRQEAIKSLAKGVFEFTVGCADVSATSLDLLLKCVVCSTLISWGGISTHFQIASILGKTDIDMGFYIRAKLCHALLAAMVSFGMGGVLFKMTSPSAQTGLFGSEITGMGAVTVQNFAAIGVSAGHSFIETVQIFTNKFLFSSQMLVMLIIVFTIVTILGRMSYQITTWIQKWYKRRQDARKRRREEKEANAARWSKAAARSGRDRS